MFFFSYLSKRVYGDSFWRSPFKRKHARLFANDVQSVSTHRSGHMYVKWCGFFGAYVYSGNGSHPVKGSDIDDTDWFWCLFGVLFFV